MKKVAFILCFLVFSCNSESGYAKKTPNQEQKKRSEHLYNFVTRFAAKDKTKLEHQFNTFHKSVVFIASYKNDLSDEYLAKLHRYYLGSATGNFLRHLFARRGDSAIRALKKLKGKKVCDEKKYRCIDRSSDVVSLVNSGNKLPPNQDETGDPFRYYEKNEMDKVYAELEKEISAL